jgi:uncharacterized membrane protein YkvA (DUF1232 family)
MLKILECPSCGQLNEVETQKFDQALCGTCKEKLNSLNEFGTYKSKNDLSAALEVTSSFPEDEKVDENEWTSKIGGSEQKEKYVEDGFFKKMKKHASKIPFAKEAVAMYFCAIDPKTPTSAKFIAFGALAYLVLPFDLIPDFILVLGYTDDAAAFWVAYNKLTVHITDEHREKAEDWLKN